MQIQHLANNETLGETLTSHTHVAQVVQALLTAATLPSLKAPLNDDWGEVRDAKTLLNALTNKWPSNHQGS